MRLYHNPRCSKSRQALALLVDRGLEFDDYRYLEHGIAEQDFELLLGMDGIVRQHDLDKSIQFDINDKQQLRKLLQDNPKALQRPILIKDGRAVIGRPPENILELLE
ncbi:MAG: ArsC/Spx/MgsR family protein [Candidatus Thermoplasmatota archaeon]|nr:ArsC/Spx/MgsR family protein [Candidatus Thermoplasmatota archaeon]